MSTTAAEIASVVFLSTPSARRATATSVYLRAPEAISIHALREEGDMLAMTAFAKDAISIHALREEGDALPLTRRCRR